MDIGSMDVEDFRDGWRRARRAWDQINQRKLAAEAAGGRLTEQELAGWLAAKTAFEEYERQWDQIYQAGVVIVVGDDDEDPGPAS